MPAPSAQKIVPSLWFPGNAAEAVELYLDVFGGKELSRQNYPDSIENGLAPFQLHLAGKPVTIGFEIGGLELLTINAGNEFSFTPATSFFLNFSPADDAGASARLDAMWERLSEGGEVLMPLGEYPFAQRYGWCKDRFEVSWQLIQMTPAISDFPFIVPCLLFSDGNVNRADEAARYYMSTFAGRGFTDTFGMHTPYPEDSGQGKAGVALMYSDYTLAGQWFATMDSGQEHGFGFNEALSFTVRCEDQEEIDYFWGRLSHVPEAEQCGWCKDQFGLSWQIVPANVEQLLQRPDAFTHMMQMKKLVIADY